MPKETSVESPVVVVPLFKAKPGQVERVREMISALIPLARSEPGVLSYEMYESADDAGVMILVERFASAEALERHRAMPYLAPFRNSVTQLLESPFPMTIWKKIG